MSGTADPIPVPGAAAMYTPNGKDSGYASSGVKNDNLNPFTGETIDGGKLWFKPVNAGGSVRAEDAQLPFIARKGWVQITQANPVTKAMGSSTSQGLLCVAEMEGQRLRFSEVYACISQVEIYALDITSFKCWSFESQHMIQVFHDEQCSVTFIVKDGPEAQSQSSKEEHQKWCKAFAMALTMPNFHSSWILNHNTLPQPWTKFDHGFFGDSTVYAAKMNKVTPVVLRHINVAKRDFPDEVDDIKQCQFLKEALLSFKIQGPGIVQLYGLFWDSAPSRARALNYYVVMELCEGGTLMDALYESDDGKPVTSAGTPKPRLSQSALRQLLLELLSGLLHLHRNQIVHRNLKPLTVALVRPIDQMDQVSNGIVKILDLSNSARLSSEASDAEIDFEADVAYPTPEMASNIHAQLPIDHPQIDVFSFGLILCEMMSYEKPWPLLQHLPMYKIEAMVQFGSRPRIDDQGRLGIAGLVRMCLMPDREDRPSLLQVVELVQHDEFFSTFNCSNANDVLSAMHAEFWTWSSTIYKKLCNACTLLWDTDVGNQEEAEKHLHTLLKIAKQFHGKYSQNTEGNAYSLFLLPMEAAAALILGENGLASRGDLASVLQKEERQFILSAMKKCDRDIGKETLRLVQVAVAILREELESIANDTQKNDNKSDNPFLADWIQLLSAASAALTKANSTPENPEKDRLYENLMEFLSLMSNNGLLASKMASSSDSSAIVDHALRTDGVSASFIRMSTKLLRNLASYPFIRVTLTKSMGIMLANLKMEKNNADATVDRLTVLHHVTQNSLGAAEFVQRGGIVVIIPIALQYGQKHPVFLECFRILHQVSLEPAHAVQVANEQAAMHAISVLKGTVRQNERPKELDTVCLSLVACIIEFPALQIELVDLGIISVLSKFGDYLDEPRNVHSVTRCFRYLAKSENFRLSLAQGRIHDVLLKILCLPCTDTSIDVFILCMNAINSISVLPVLRDEMLDGDAVRRIVDIMKQFNRDPQLQMAGLCALRNFTKTEEGRHYCERAGSISTARLILSQHSVLSKHEENLSLLKESLDFLSTLVNDPKTRPGTIIDCLIPSLVDILKLESAHMDLIEASTAMLATIALHEDCEEEFSRLRVCDILQGLIDACPTNETLSQYFTQIQQVMTPIKEEDGGPVNSTLKTPFKVVVVGEMSVGKTCFVVRGCQNSFCANVKSTIGVHIDFARIEFPQRQVVLQVYDTAGEERYRAHSRTFYRGAHSIILVYDVNDGDPYDILQSFYDEALQIVDSETVFFVVGTKTDLLGGREPGSMPSVIEAKRFARNIRAQHYTVSSIKNIGVHPTFRAVSESLYERWPNGPPRPDRDTIKLKKDAGENLCCF